MRTEQDWNKMALPKLLLKLPKRFQKVWATTKLRKSTLSVDESYYIWGEVGTGKTILAAQMWLEAKKQMWLKVETGDVIMISMPELILTLTETFDNPSVSTPEVLAKYSDAAYLIIDDFGTERSTEYVYSVLYLIVNRRFENMLPTVFTSNLDLDTIADRLNDDRITNRIVLMCKEIIKKKPFK